MQVRLIIIGAYDYSSQFNKDITIDILNNFKKWNNPSQAEHLDIIDTINNIYSDHPDMTDVDCVCIDPQYKFNACDKDHNIQYVMDHFTFGDTAHFKESAHNIVIEFANILDEYFVTKESSNSLIVRNAYNNFKMTWISCGCGWNKNLPTQLIQTIIENQLYTPTNCSDKYSYIYSSNITKIYTEELFKPYFQGLYQMLGSFMWRGCKNDNFLYEDILYEFIEETLKTETFEDNVQNELIQFVLCEARWNELNRKTRKTINDYVYGTIITIT